MGYSFGEKRTEWSVKQGKEVAVWQTPKYEESRAKAVEILDSGKYGLKASDFWILMNETKSGKMAYSGLIISHNGCLKINDALDPDSKFKPECVMENQDGWKGSLVMTYCCPEQGLYEVGEVSDRNCKNDYPYAMAFKRLFDRVVLKASKIAYAGIYSETEADEFRNPQNEVKEEPKAEPKKEAPVKCARCGKYIESYIKDGKTITPDFHASASKQKFGEVYCLDCIAMLKMAQNAENARHQAVMEGVDE